MATTLEVKGGTVIVDEDMLEKLATKRWYIRKDGYVRADIGRRGYVYMHTYVFGRETVYTIDHINRNKLDNRRENLRCVSMRTNVLNSDKAVKGYYWRPERNAWVVRYLVNGRQIYYGQYNTEEEAQQRAKEVRLTLLKEAGL